jgi:acetolactate synthase-1/3 small subunit
MVKLPIDANLADVEALCRGYNGKVANANENWVIVMVSDKPARVTNFLKAMKRFNPKEVVRSGVVAIERN